MTDGIVCSKIDDCPKVGMVMGKDLAMDEQYATAVRGMCARCPEKQEPKQQFRYVRLSATALYRAPDCYGSGGEPVPSSGACIYCIVRGQCQARQEVVRR